MPLPLVIPAIGAAALLALSASRNDNAAKARKLVSRHAMPWKQFTALTAQASAARGVPEAILWVVATIETGRNPGATNLDDPRAAKKGGAWGLFQVTLDTAKDLFRRYPDLRKAPAAKPWDGTGRSLLDPQLNMLLAAAYLAKSWKEFGDVWPTIASYQQGSAPVRALVARGGNLFTDLPPNGRIYLARARQALAQLEAQQAGHVLVS